MNFDERTKWATHAITLLDVLFKEDNSMVTSITQDIDNAHLLNHAWVVLKYAEEFEIGLDIAVGLLRKMGFYLYNHYDFEASKKAFEKIIIISKRINMPIYELDLIFITLGEIERILGNLESSKKYLEESLKIIPSNQGIPHPIEARILQKLASVLKELGDFENAKAYLERAIAIDTDEYNSNNRIFVSDYRDLGLILMELDNFTAAKSYLEKSIAINRKTLALNKLPPSSDYRNLGLIMMHLGDVHAKDNLETSIEIDEKVNEYDPCALALEYRDFGLKLKELNAVEISKVFLEKSEEISNKIIESNQITGKMPKNDSNTILKDGGR